MHLPTSANEFQFNSNEYLSPIESNLYRVYCRFDYVREIYVDSALKEFGFRPKTTTRSRGIRRLYGRDKLVNYSAL